ncbi:MAG: 16S rRNA (guanine(527)-N(7))-methyltransferase RsmG [Treponema sp.]|nr:16S rRNA (guanine(527)-N(7))-methyltransferase RsmG [Treponema sp.]
MTLLNTYIEEIELFNPAYGLVKVKDRQELVVKHILDSLGPLGIIRRLLNRNRGGSSAIADAGSGAGLPGIPLAICLTGHSFTFIERMGKRAGFLRNTQAVLGLRHVAVDALEMERAAPGRFSLITFRALSPLNPVLLTSLFRLLGSEGILAAYKGRKNRIETEMRAVEYLTAGWEAMPLQVPFLEEERHLVIIRKPVDEL